MGLSGVNSPLPVGTVFDLVMIDKLLGWQFISSLKVGAFLLICCNYEVKLSLSDKGFTSSALL